jgi:hypothetical protein
LILPTDVGETPVAAAYPGYLTRLPDWRSSVIIRVPQDPLMPSREIWVYYTHMADRDGSSFISANFPPGTSEQYVEASSGYQETIRATANPVGVHLRLHRKERWFRELQNELDIDNTYDPSPWFGLELNARANPGQIPLCGQP